MIYLASPYSDPDPKVRRRRYEQALLTVGAIMVKGGHVFSPIVYTHEVAQRFDLPKDHEYWQAFNHHMLRTCDEVRVLKLAGWSASLGIRDECAMANLLSIKITFCEAP